MFEINVHGEALEQRRIAHQKATRALLIRSGYLAVLVLLTGIFSFHVFSLYQNLKSRGEEMEKIQETIAQYTPEGGSLSPDDLLVLSRVKGGQIRWGDKLEILCALLPPQMWVREVTLKNHIIENVNREVVVISGSTQLTDEHAGLDQVLELLGTLRNDANFSNGFKSIELLSSKRSMTLEKKQLDFDFICAFR